MQQKDEYTVEFEFGEVELKDLIVEFLLKKL